MNQNIEVWATVYRVESRYGYRAVIEEMAPDKWEVAVASTSVPAQMYRARLADPLWDPFTKHDVTLKEATQWACRLLSEIDDMHELLFGESASGESVELAL